MRLIGRNLCITPVHCRCIITAEFAKSHPNIGDRLDELIPALGIAEFARRWKTAELALFGSVLRDDFDSDSDVDVLVSFEPAATWRREDANRTSCDRSQRNVARSDRPHLVIPTFLKAKVRSARVQARPVHHQKSPRNSPGNRRVRE